MSFPKDESTPWGSTAVAAYWEGEGAAATEQKIKALEEDTLKLRKLQVLVAATDELLADATAMSGYITAKCGAAVDWKVQDAILNGTGAGMPKGILTASSLVTQTKESAQTAATVNAQNIAKMYKRLLKNGSSNIAWLINPDVFDQIITLSLNNNLLWTPPNEGFKGAPDGLLFGRPIITTDACQTLGTKGDVVLANMSGYRAITKSGGVEFAQSMHLWFDQGVQAFRLTFRMDGQPALSSAVSPKNGSTTRGHFICLETRA
jgi:HK97 family phage major capsid protein